VKVSSVTLRVRNMSGASGSPPAKHSKKEDEPKESPPAEAPKEKGRTVPALTAPIQPALLKVSALTCHNPLDLKAMPCHELHENPLDLKAMPFPDHGSYTFSCTLAGEVADVSDAFGGSSD